MKVKYRASAAIAIIGFACMPATASAITITGGVLNTSVGSFSDTGRLR